MTALRQIVLEKQICQTLRLAAAEAEALSLGVPVSDRDVLCSWVPSEEH